MAEKENLDCTIDRALSSSLDGILGKVHKVLDHGFIRVVDYMGNDSSIVQAARVSYGEGTKSVLKDSGLIGYLMKHKHTTPFEMCEIKLHVKLPIFVARQWIRHRTANVNECSARYSTLPKEFYVPELSSIGEQSLKNKQCRKEPMEEGKAKNVCSIITDTSNEAYDAYQNLMSEEYNLARELARVNLTLNYYTEMYWKIDLHNLLHFLRLRMHEHAQHEMREYANVIFEIAKSWCPVAVNSFEEHVLNSVTLSGKQVQCIKMMIGGKSLESSVKELDLPRREAEELTKTLGI